MALREEDRVALLVPGSHRYLEAVLRMLTAGVFPIPLDPRLTDTERRRILAPLDPAVVVTSDEQLADLLPTLPAPALPRGRPMHCTSGTTGTPKGVWSGLLPEEQAQALVAPAAAPVRPLGRGRRPGPVLLPAGRACRRAVPDGGQAAADRGLPAGSP